MKKPLICIFIGLGALVIVAFVISVYSLGKMVKNRIEVVGPIVTQVEVKLDHADVWLMPGRVQLKGLTLGNPPEYKTKASIKTGEISVRMNFLSALSAKTIIDNITVKSPEITIEGGLKKNNLTQIRGNVESYSSSPPAQASPVAPPAAGPAARRYQINELIIQGARLHIVSLFSTGKDVTLPLPDIHLYGLGAGPDGITLSETAEKTLTAMLNSISANAADALAGLSKDAVSKAKKFDFKKAGQKLMKLFGQ